ncbi:MAG: bifunctional 4-hydroxy-2-oxoglutarate aldolase/2-dehydro-3-deoxy-phosphogluconate aldolase [Bacillota bacterium]|nr:bifunctional 4-hydroxy-2-oxoglutarate aldolase/2-dehydro-3-deoxy-phosphogluconate aldolase [Bacillota bacterium]
METFFEHIKKCGIVPAVLVENSEDAVPLAEALLSGGINIMEFTLRTEAALKAIEAVRKYCSGMTIGAGTVLRPDQVDMAFESGAQFLISPGCREKVILAAKDKKLHIIPGVATPTEIETGIELGIDVFNFFPANVLGGVKAIKAFGGPYSSVQFIPSGSVTTENMCEYLCCKQVMAVSGSWITPPEIIRNHHFKDITALAKQAVQFVKSVRN